VPKVRWCSVAQSSLGGFEGAGVASSCIASMLFNPDEHVLTLAFRNGLSYEYLGVPSTLYAALLAAESKGAFIARFVRGSSRFGGSPGQAI
jgi:hypothetical protein